MALSTILLRESRTSLDTVWIPGKLAKSYADLEERAFESFSKNPQEQKVHLYLEDGKHTGRIIPSIWNSAGYFDEPCIQGGKLHLFADFETKPGHIIENAEQGPPDNTYEKAVVEDQHGYGVGRPRKRTRAQTLAASNGSEGYAASPGELSSDKEDGVERLRNDSHLLPLPLRATIENHQIHFDAYKTANALPHEYGHKRNWDLINNDYRAKVAHARLIEGVYGVPSPVPCDRCLDNGVRCRVYHPDLKALNGSCGECRLHSRTCIMNGQGRRTSRQTQTQKKQKTIPVLRREDTGSDDEDEQWLCPVEGCERASEGFTQRQNLARHISVKHLGTAVPQNNSSGKTHASADETHIQGGHKSSALTCPVQRCTSRSAVTGFSRLQGLQEHIREHHPSSIHAQNLLFPGRKPVIVLPPAPSTEEHMRDLAAACLNNVKPGEYEYRDDARWLEYNPTTRKKIAHARLIHGKYGVPAPEPCTHCRSNMVECRVYHPDLESKGSGTRCSYCRPRQGVCDLDPFPFDEYTIRVQHSAGVPKAHRPKKDREINSITSKKVLAQQSSTGQEEHGNFFCPVHDCPSRNIGSLPKFEDVRQHIRLSHPGTNHALVLEAVETGNSTTLRPPPSNEVLQAAEKFYQDQNAPYGEFGHRDPHVWATVGELSHSRVAKARVVHRYGVLAPKPCEDCQRKRITCVVNHPDLWVPGKMAGNFCSECKLGSRTCHLQLSMFDFYHNRPESSNDGRFQQSSGVKHSTKGCFGTAEESTFTEKVQPGRLAELLGSNDRDQGLEADAFEKRKQTLGSQIIGLGSSAASSAGRRDDSEAKKAVQSGTLPTSYSGYAEFYERGNESTTQQTMVPRPINKSTGFTSTSEFSKFTTPSTAVPLSRNSEALGFSQYLASSRTLSELLGNQSKNNSNP